MLKAIPTLRRCSRIFFHLDEDDDEYCKYLYKEFVRDTDPTKNDAEPIESIVKELGIPPDKQE